MATLTPVEGNPFERRPATGGYRLTPVEGNPFAGAGAAPLMDRTFENPEDEALYQQLVAEETERRSRPRVPMSGVPEAATPEEFAIQTIQNRRAKEQSERAFEESRTPLKRVTDASTFALSMPVRAISRGEYGLGDVAGLVSDDAAQIYGQAEQDFARANQSWLEPVAMAGEASLAIPGLQALGAPARSVGPAMRTMTASPRGTVAGAIRGTGEVLDKWSRQPGGVVGQGSNVGLPTAVGRVGRNMQAYADNMAPPASTRGPGPQATAAQAYGPAERIADRAAFQAEEIPEFAPAFTSKGTARIARTIEEMPFIGGTVKVPKTAVEQAMLARQGQVAQGLGAAASPEDVGLITQRGLNRFRSAELHDLDRDTVQRLGISPTRPPRAVAGTVDISRPGRLNTANFTPDELDLAASSNVTLPQSLRTTIDDLQPAELARVIAQPARNTSFATRAEALYKQAHDAVPQMQRANETLNPGRLALRNSRRIAENLLEQERRSSISGGVLEGRFGGLVERMRNPHSHMSLDEMRAARTEVGRALSNFGQFDVRLDRTQLQQLYAGLSDDYQAGLVALAARARRASRLAPNDPRYVSPSVAAAADRALQQYRVADRYYRGGIGRMNRFLNVLGAETLEQASRRIGQYLRENTQNIRALESMETSLRPEEWRSVLGNVIEGLGRFTPGAREAERVFSFERYATDWNKISQNPRVLALFRRSLGNEVVQSLNNMGRIAERMKRYETTTNYSGSAYTAIGGAGVATLLNPAMWPYLAGGVAGAGVTGKLLTSRAFASWVNSLNQAQVRVGSSVAATRQAARPHVQRLMAAAAREPDPEVAAAMAAIGLTIEQQLDAIEQGAARQ